MAKKDKETKEWEYGISPDTEIELIAIKGEVVYKQETTFLKALEKIKNKTPGWVYRIYQKGYSQFQNAKILK